jgi:hypothetical protein
VQNACSYRRCCNTPSSHHRSQIEIGASGLEILSIRSVAGEPAFVVNRELTPPLISQPESSFRCCSKLIVHLLHELPHGRNMAWRSLFAP